MTGTIGRFELIGVVADRTGSTVWKGHDPGLDRDVALKQVPVSDALALTRLRAEARTLSTLRHPNLVQVFEIVETVDHVWLVEDWVEGAALPAVIAACGRLTARQSVGVIRGALGGLAYAHERGIVHGDISLSNILVDSEGTSRLIDFGLAVLAGTTGSSGTPGYISPEAMLGEPLTSQSDVYSSAAVLVSLMTGRTVFGSTTPEQSVARQLTEPSPDLAGIDTPIREVLHRALDPDPANRQADAAQLLAELDGAADRGFGVGWLVHAGVTALITTTMVASVGLTTGAAAGAGAIASPGTASPVPSAAPVAAKQVRLIGRTVSRKALTATGGIAAAVIATVVIILLTSGNSAKMADSAAPAANSPAAVVSTAPSGVSTAATAETSGAAATASSGAGPATTSADAGAQPIFYTHNTASLTFTQLFACDVCTAAQQTGTIELTAGSNSAFQSPADTYNAFFSSDSPINADFGFFGLPAGTLRIPPGAPPPTPSAHFQVSLTVPLASGDCCADLVFAQTGNVGSGYEGTCELTITPDAGGTVSGSLSCPSLMTVSPGSEPAFKWALSATFTLAP